MDGLSELGYRFEPHDHITSPCTPARLHPDRRGGGGVYPGYGDWVVGGEGYTGTHPDTLPGPINELNLASRPYPRPNEGKSEVISKIDLRLTSD